MDFTGGKPLLTSGLFESLTAQIDILVDRANTNMLQKMCLTASALATIGWAHCAEAAPVLWSMAPSGTGNSPNNGAQALDELTAPLSSDEMGLSNSVEFNTIFDNDLDEDNRSTWVGNWESAIISDLDNSNPVYLDGSSAALGGHAWVCDGYDDGPSTTLFHMNWGWNCSTQDGWYSISGNNPSTQFPTSEGRIKEIFPGTDLIAMSGYTSTFSGGIFTHRVENDFGNFSFISLIDSFFFHISSIILAPE